MLGAFNNTFGNVFDLKNDKEKLILEKLESARNAIQWGEEIELLDVETVDYTCEKLQWMKNEVQKVFQEQERKVKEIFGNHGN